MCHSFSLQFFFLLTSQIRYNLYVLLYLIEESEEEVSSDEELDLKEAAKLRSEKKKVRIYSSDESESEKAESEGTSPKNMKQIIHSIIKEGGWQEYPSSACQLHLL